MSFPFFVDDQVCDHRTVMVYDLLFIYCSVFLANGLQGYDGVSTELGKVQVCLRNRNNWLLHGLVRLARRIYLRLPRDM